MRVHGHSGFFVLGPYEMRNTNDDFFTRPRIEKFWGQTEGLAERKGCYVFGLRVGRGITPWYVGKTSRQDFGHEVFGPHQRSIYLEVIRRRYGTPVWFLLPINVTRGRTNHLRIGELETELIRRAGARNADLKNRHSRYREDWIIHSYDCGCRGRKTNDGRHFRLMLHGE